MKYFLVVFLTSVVATAGIEVQGHRGARSLRAENTIAAFEYALKVGVDTLELDLAVTKDNILVVSHDPVLNPVICRDINGQKLKQKVVIHSLSLKQLRKFNCSSLVNPRFPKQKIIGGQKIPTLREVFDLVKNSKLKVAQKIEFNIETKLTPGYPDRTPGPKKFARILVDLIKEYKWEKRVVVQSFDHRSLKAVKQLDKSIRVAALMGGAYILNWVEMAQSIPADIISPNQYWITRTSISRLQKNGIRVIPWTANTKEEWDRLIALGVDGIISDDPKALIEFLKEKKLR